MASFDLGLSFAIGRFERWVVGIVCACVAVLEAAGGRERLVIAGFFAATAVFLLRPAAGRLRQGVDFAVDFAVVAAFAFLCDPAGVLWRAPERLERVFALTPVGASVAAALYLVGVAFAPRASRAAMRAALFVLPFLFCLLIALGSPAIGELGGAAVPRLRRSGAHPRPRRARSGAVPAQRGGRSSARRWRSAAIFRSNGARMACCSLAAARRRADAGDRQPRLDALRRRSAGARRRRHRGAARRRSRRRGCGARPISSPSPWRECCAERPRCRSSCSTTGAPARMKGAVYGLVFMALLLVAGLVVTFPPALARHRRLGAGRRRDPRRRRLSAGARHRREHRIRRRPSSRGSSANIARIENFPRGFVAGAAVGRRSARRSAGSGRRRALPVRRRRRRARLCRRRRGLRSLRADATIAASICAAGASMRSARCSAASSAAPSPGISTPAS